MNEWQGLKFILDASVERNGNITLTTGHLLNIIRMVDRNMAAQESISEDQYYRLMEEDYKWGED